MFHWKTLVRDIVPPLLMRSLKRVLRIYPALRFEGDFGSWEAASAKCDGYSARNIVEKVTQATEFVLENENYIERDGVVFLKTAPPFNLLWALDKALSEFGALRVLDFGGALGSHYRSVREYLPKNASIIWNVVEQRNFVDAARRFETEELRFFESVENMGVGLHVNFIIISSVLQYLVNPLEQVDKFSRLSAEYLFIDRTPMLLEQENAFVVQKVPEAIYKASYPAALFRKSEYINVLKKSWELIAEWRSPVSLTWLRDGKRLSVPFFGMLLRKHGM